MNNQFIVQAREITLFDESGFLGQGGQDFHFGALEGGTVRLYASGSPEAIRSLARNIIAHHTSAQ